jgi:hypothetical protein
MDNETIVTISAERNARFWVYSGNAEGGWVKLTLKPGQTLSHASGGPCDEGYSYREDSWTHNGDHLQGESSTESRDCDGRYSHYWEGHAIDLLPHWDHYKSGNYVDEDPTLLGLTPSWVEGECSVRDHSAEAAGY